MNEYGDTEPTDLTRPEAGRSPEPAPHSVAPRPGSVAPTWQWTGTQPGLPPTSAGGYPGPATPADPIGDNRPGISRRTRGLGVAAALLLVGGAAAAGGAFGFAHGHDGSSAAGIASGDSGATAPAIPGQTPPRGRGPSAQEPGHRGSGAPDHRRGGHASSYIPPGHATAEQQTGVVIIDTRLKYQIAKAAGTGMVVSADGEVLTNNHVIEGATKIKVTVVNSGKTYTAKVVGTDKVDDIAVLRLIGASGLQTIKPDTDGVQVGDPVTAVGNAMGLGGIPSAARGNVTGLDRSITTQSEGSVDGERLTGMIQVDAQVISGDSGGPLYDADNEVIGMDTAASSSPMQSLGFAIPIAKAMSIADRIESGQAGGDIMLGVPAFLGVEYTPASHGSGALITGVIPRTPAARLGLLPGDTVTSLSGTAVTSGEQLKTLLAQRRGGDSVSLSWTDSRGGSHTASVTLVDGPAE